MLRTRMKSVVEPLEGNKVKLSVEVDEAEFEKALDAAFKRIAREVRLPGFRPGKAPRRLIEARVGLEAARQEALRGSLPEYYAQAVKEAELDVIAAPEIDITAGQEDGPIVFDAVVEIRPQVSIIGYGGLRVTVESPLASDEDVDRHIDRLRQQSAELTKVERPALTGDHVSIDVQGSRDGEAVPALSADDYLYEVGSALVVAELDEHLTGANVGDILKFDAPLELAGPEADEDAELVSFRVLVKSVSERALPEVNDEWAGEVSEFDTVDELRSDLRNRLSVAKRMQANLAIRDEAVGALVELVDDDPPEPLVREDMEGRLRALSSRLSQRGATLPQYLEATQITEEQLVTGLRHESVNAVKADLALRALAEAECLDATDEELDADVAQLAERVGQKPAELRRALERQDAMATVRSDVRKAKALEWLVEHVEIVDTSGHPVDRADLSTPAEPPSETQEGETNT